MRRFSSFGLCLLALGGFLPSGVAWANGTAESDSDAEPAERHWDQTAVILVVGPRVTALTGGSPALGQALAAWATLEPDLPIVSVQLGAGPTFAQERTKTNTVAFGMDRDPRLRGRLAVTAVSVDESGAIVGADILLNPSYRFADIGHLGAQHRCDKYPVYDLQNVLTHELGHWFGLKDDDGAEDSTMYPFIAPGETSKRTPTERDRLAMELLYRDSEASDEAEVGCGASIAGHADSPKVPWFSVLGVAAMTVALRWRRRTTWGVRRSCLMPFGAHMTLHRWPEAGPLSRPTKEEVQ